MPAHCIFQGSRKQFLLDRNEDYAEAVQGGYVKDELAKISRAYFKRFPIELPHDEEPSAEHLASVNDDAPDVEVIPPDPEILSSDNYQKALVEYEMRRRMIVSCKAQIQRQMAGQYMKENTMDPKESGAHSPYRILLHKLTGQGLQKPCRKPAKSFWRGSEKSKIEALATARVGHCDPKVLHKKLAAQREKVAAELYTKLGQEEKDKYKQMSLDEHKEAMEKWECDANGPLSQDPADRQRCIEQLVFFVQPILDMIAEATGWKVTLVAGGPQPADDGLVHIVSIHSGTTRGEIKMNFGRSEQANYQKYFIPMFNSFLQKCYTVEECHACALPADRGFEGLAAAVADTAATVSTGASPLPVTSAPSTSDSLPTPAASEVAISNAGPSQPLPMAKSVEPQPAPSLPTATHAEAHHLPSQPPLPLSRLPCSVPSSPPANPSPPPSRAPSLAWSPPPSPSTFRSRQPEVPQDVLLDTPSAGSSTRRPVISPGPGPGSSISPPSVSLTTPAMQMTAPPPPSNPLSARTAPLSGDKRSIDEVQDSQQGAGKSKKSKLPSASSSHSSSPSAPPWFTRSSNMFAVGTGGKRATSSAPLGREWMLLVDEWSRFERESNYASGSFLPSKHRPVDVSQWLKHARSPDWWPSKMNFTRYTSDFDLWWTGMQPAWRVKDGKIVEELVDGEWGDLKTSGVNGVLSLMAGLFFWSLHAHEQPDEKARWLLAIASFHRVLRCW